MSEFNVGDEVQHEFDNSRGVVLAVGPEWLYVKELDGHPQGWHTAKTRNLTRIEPDVPQPPLYAVGQTVRGRFSGRAGRIILIEQATKYRCQKANGECFTLRAEDIEVACPTCGKVG